MNTGVQKLLSLGTSLAIGVGLGLFANRSRDAPFVGLSSPPAPAAPPSNVLNRPAPELEALGLTGKLVPADAREFRQLSAEEGAKLEGLIIGFQISRDDARRLEIMEQIHGHYYGEGLLALVSGVLDSPEKVSPAVRQEAIRMLSGNVSPKILPVLNSAFTEAEAEEKKIILMAVARVRGKELVDFIAAGFEDPSVNVRFAALDVVSHQDAASKGKLLVRALVSSNTDIALAALGELEVEASPDSLPMIFRGLASPCAKVREETKATLQFLLDQDFEDPAAATVWWQHNRHRFDRNLIRLE